jgi:penicillin amidase
MGIQMDVFSVLAKKINPMLIEALDKGFADKRASKLKELLLKWDFMMDREGVAASIFEATFRQMLDLVFKDELGEELFNSYLKTVSFPPRAIGEMAETANCLFCDDVTTPQKETFRDIIAGALQKAVSELEKTFGEDLDRWKWGSLHTLTFEHPLGKKRPLDLIFNLGPFPVEGNPLTVNKKQYHYDNPYACNHGVSMRMIVDLATPDGAYHVLPTGESGMIKSPHNKDQTALYLSGGYRQVPFSRTEVEKKARAILVLRP